MVTGAEFDGCDSAGGDFDTRGHAATGEFVLQPAAVDLVGDLGRERGASEFHALGDVGVSVVGEKHSQAHFADLRRVQVIGQLEAVPQVLSGYLDGRLADGVGDLR